MELGDSGCVGDFLALRAVLAGGSREVDAIKLAVNMPDLTDYCVSTRGWKSWKELTLQQLTLRLKHVGPFGVVKVEEQNVLRLDDFGGWEFGETKVTMTWAWHSAFIDFYPTDITTACWYFLWQRRCRDI